MGDAGVPDAAKLPVESGALRLFVVVDASTLATVILDEGPEQRKTA
jgi:hypothetical protein